MAAALAFDLATMAACRSVETAPIDLMISDRPQYFQPKLREHEYRRIFNLQIFAHESINPEIETVPK